MPPIGPIDLPPNVVPPVAVATAQRAKSIAAVLGTLAGIFVVAAIGMVFGKSHHDHELVYGVAIWEVGLCTPMYFFIRRAMRASRAATRAAADPGTKWTLVGKLVVAADDRGIPMPDLTFKVSGGQRTMLLAVPAAHVVNRDP